MTGPADRSAVLVLCTALGEVLGALPEVAVPVPWWAEVGPVVEAARDRYALDVVVLRLLDAPDSPVPAGGRVAYLAEVARGARPPGELRPLDPHDPLALAAAEDHPRRAPWARPGGVAATVARADAALAGAGLERTAPARQVKSWNLSSVLALGTTGGTVWCKSVPPFLAHEGAVVTALARPGRPGDALAPAPLATWDEPGGASTTLLADVPGRDRWDASPAAVAAMVRRWVAVQAAWAERLGDLPHAVPDRRAEPLLAAVRGLVQRPDVRADLDAGEAAGLDELAAALPGLLAELAGCGLPDTLVHRDLHPGNWRGPDGPGGPDDASALRLLDWGDSVVGHPALDLRADTGDGVVAAWAGAWAEHRPGCDGRRAARLARPLTALTAALVYRAFLDGIERSERRYHERDPASMLRSALASWRSRGAS